MMVGEQGPRARGSCGGTVRSEFARVRESAESRPVFLAGGTGLPAKLRGANLLNWAFFSEF